MKPRLELRRLLRPGSPGARSLLELAAALDLDLELQDSRGRRVLGEARGAELERMPLALDGEPLGVLLGPARARPLVALVEQLAAQERDRRALGAEALGAWRELTLLQRLSERLAGTLQDPRQLTVALSEALTEVARALRAPWGVVLLAEAADSPPERVAVLGAGAAPELQGLIAGAWRCLVEGGRAELVDQSGADPRFEGPGRSLMWAPLASPEGLRGAMVLGREPGGEGFTAGELSLLGSVAAVAAPAVQNARAYEDLDRLVRRRTEELLAAKEQADQANQAKTRFLANMSHELRTPLNALLGYAQLLRRGELDQRRRHGLEVIQSSGEHLLGLIEELLDLSRIEAGGLELQSVELSLRGLVEELAAMLRPRAEQLGLGFVVRLEEGLPARVRGDLPRLRQVLLNLLGNALKYTERGAVGLVVEPAGERVRFEVRDTGAGIAPEDQGAVFEAFRQLPTEGRPAEGVGLGLAISRRLVQRMGGELRLWSRPGEGSRFAFELPLPACEEALGVDASREVVGFEGQGMRILVVEDDEAGRAVLMGLLAPLGFELRAAVDGREGVALARAWRPHAVLMDLELPELDGLGAIAALRADPELSRTVILVISARVFPEDRRRSLEAGADAFLPKPLRRGELLATLGGLLPLRWRRREAEQSAEALTPPPAQALEGLHEAASLGRIAEVRRSLDALEGEHAAFVAPLRELAQSFQLDELALRLASLVEGRGQR